MSLPAVGTDKTRGISPCRRFEGHTGWVRGVIHLPGGQRIITCSEDGSLRMWDLKSGEQIGKDWQDEESAVYAITLSPDGKQLVGGSDDDTVRLWDIDTGKVITKWTGHRIAVKSVHWNRDGGRVLSGSFDGTARVWDVESGETILAINTGLGVYSAIYSPDETMIATGGRGDIKIFDAKTAKFLANLKGHTQIVYCLAWTADGTTLISGSEDESIRTWNTTTWQQINLFTGHTGRVKDIAISPDDHILASASWDSTVRLWNLENRQPIASPLQHANIVACVSFSTDGKLLATGCNNNNAYTWDMPTILREAGLDELLLNPNSLLKADATQRPAQRRRRDNIDPRANRLPPGFFDDSLHHPPPSRRHPISATVRQYDVVGHPSSDRRGVLGRLSSLFQRNNYSAQAAPPRTHLRERVSNPFSRRPRRRHDEGMELQEHHPTFVDVPFTRGNPRNVSAAQVRMKKERMKKEKERTKKTKNAYAGSSRPPQSSVTQQSGGAAQPQPSSELHADIATLSTTPALAATSAVCPSTTLPPDAIIPRAGRWTRLWLFVGCVSAQYTDGHH